MYVCTVCTVFSINNIISLIITIYYYRYTRDWIFIDISKILNYYYYYSFCCSICSICELSEIQNGHGRQNDGHSKITTTGQSERRVRELWQPCTGDVLWRAGSSVHQNRGDAVLAEPVVAAADGHGPPSLVGHLGNKGARGRHQPEQRYHIDQLRRPLVRLLGVHDGRHHILRRSLELRGVHQVQRRPRAHVRGRTGGQLEPSGRGPVRRPLPVALQHGVGLRETERPRMFHPVSESNALIIKHARFHYIQFI